MRKAAHYTTLGGCHIENRQNRHVANINEFDRGRPDFVSTKMGLSPLGSKSLVVL